MLSVAVYVLGVSLCTVLVTERFVVFATVLKAG